MDIYGEKVDPVEVERAHEQDRAVARALVFGVAHPRFGHVVAGAIVPRPAGGADLTALPWAVSARLLSRLARFKCPRLYAVVAELPLGPGGKPDRLGAAATLVCRLEPVPGVS